MRTQYRDIRGWDKYKIGINGEVWSCKRGYWKKLKPFPVSKYGHLCVELCNNNRNHRKVVLVHHLVLKAFVGPCPPGMECRHLDGNSRNNNLRNLKWGTHLENENDRVRHGTLIHGVKVHSAKLSVKEVKQIKKMLACGKYSNQRIAVKFKTSSSTICDIKKGRRWVRV